MLPLLVPDTSLMDVTWSIGPMSLLLIVPAPVLRDGSLPVGFAGLVDGGVVDGGVVDGGVDGLVVDGVVDDGFVDDGLDVPPIVSLSVPFT